MAVALAADIGDWDCCRILFNSLRWLAATYEPSEVEFELRNGVDVAREAGFGL